MTPAMFHWHKWQFVKQTTLQENKGACGPEGETVTVMWPMNVFRCERCGKEVWQDVSNPVNAIDINRRETIDPVRHAYFKVG
jgi:hypothetical protein